MPTSLLLLSIQVSAASNLADELPVTFCGRGRGLVLRLRGPAGTRLCHCSKEALSRVLRRPQSPVLLNAQQSGRWKSGLMRAREALCWEESMRKHTRKQRRSEAAKTKEPSQGPKREPESWQFTLGKMKKSVGMGWGGRAVVSPCPSLGLSFLIWEMTMS